MMEIADVHKGTKLVIDGVLYNVEDAEFTKPGKGRSVYRFKMRSLKDGSTIERTYRSGEKVDSAQVMSDEKQYLYRESDHYVFMDNKTFEQYFVHADTIGDRKYFMKEGMTVIMQTVGDQPIDITLPNTVEMQIVESEATTKTATITPQTKSSVLETGYAIETPAFIKTGDIIKVDTRTGTYVERVTGKK